MKVSPLRSFDNRMIYLLLLGLLTVPGWASTPEIDLIYQGSCSYISLTNFDLTAPSDDYADPTFSATFSFTEYDGNAFNRQRWQITFTDASCETPTGIIGPPDGDSNVNNGGGNCVLTLDNYDYEPTVTVFGTMSGATTFFDNFDPDTAIHLAPSTTCSS